MTELKTAQGNSERTKAVILLVITAILWSTSGLLIKLIDWNPLAITGVRSFFAAILMWGYTKRPKLNRSGWQWAAAFAYAGTVIFFVMANKMTTSANAILLQYTAPIYVVLFARLFLGEKTSGIDWVTIIVVLSGMALFQGRIVSRCFLGERACCGQWCFLCPDRRPSAETAGRCSG